MDEEIEPSQKCKLKVVVRKVAVSCDVSSHDWMNGCVNNWRDNKEDRDVYLISDKFPLQFKNPILTTEIRK